jgi:2-methylcitrate dehydratase PrpD
MSIARDLAAFLTRVSYADIPSQALEHGAMLISSTLASAACGSGIASSSIMRDVAKERGGTPDASIWFDAGPKLPVASAAQVNAVMSDAAASDDSDLRNIVHAGTTLVSTSLAIAERTGASGQDVLAAIVLGYEASGRIGEAITPAFQTRGFHGCLVAIFGGAVAAARLLRLDEAQMAQAIALSATSIGGLRAAADTSESREYHAGLAAMLGIQAALAAQRGYAAEESILETQRGFFTVYGDTDGASVTRGMGDAWDIITDMAIKLSPGGHPSHSLAEAAANAARAGQIAPDDVETITLSRPGVTALTGPIHPTDFIDMAHSPAYFLAAGVADHGFSWEHAAEAKITDPVIHQLIDKVQVGPPPTQEVERYKQGATVTIQTKDGRTFTSTVFAPKGAGVLGIDWADVDAKYRSLVPQAQVSGQQVESSLRVIHDFANFKNVSELTDLLHAY